MLNIECQVTLSVLMYLYYHCRFGLTGNSRPSYLKIARNISVLPFISASVKLRNATICFMSVCLSVSPHGKSRLPPEGIS